MHRPWDTKLTHELSEHEMLDYVRHMEYDETFDRLENIERMVEACVEHWHRQREQNSGFPYLYTTHPTTGWYSETATVPESSFSFSQKIVKIYPWMDEKHVRYLARMQIEEQYE